MKLLLDTHIWVWSVLEPARLKPRVARALLDRNNELWLSSLSVWEVLMLAEKRRMTFTVNVETWVDQARQAGPFREAPLTHDIALATRGVSLAHADPVDRFLVATAVVLDLTLVTADAHLIKQTSVRVLANR